MVPATMTLSRERLREIFQTVGTYEDKEGSRFLGATMEGPFLSAARKGAQKGEYIQKPDVAFLREMQELSGGRIRQVVVAPEEVPAQVTQAEQQQVQRKTHGGYRQEPKPERVSISR